MILLSKYFLDHPKENKMTYMQHFFFSSKLGLYFGICSMKAFVHAMIPFCFETSSSDVIKELKCTFDDCHV
jgi:hypothetical protein